VSQQSPLSDSNRRPTLYIVDGSEQDDIAAAEWPDEAPKMKDAA